LLVARGMRIPSPLRAIIGVWIVFCALFAARSLHAQNAGPILLEDFSTLRANGDSPPNPMWGPYANPDGGRDYANQFGSIANGAYQLSTVGRPYFHFQPYPYADPNGFAKQNLRSGVWDKGVNRLRFWIMPGRTLWRRADGGTIAEIGTYTKRDDGVANYQGDHYYHYLDPNFYASQWMLVTINRVPQHLVDTTDPVPTYPENPTAARGWNYFDGLTRFYFCDEYGSAADWNGNYFFSDFEFDLVAGEPDTLVSTVTATYSGDHYEISWQGPRNSVQSYTVYMSPTSMKADPGGVSSGTPIGATATPGYTYTGVIVASPKMPQSAGGMYFAIQPAGQDAFTEIYLPTGPYLTPPPLTPQRLLAPIVPARVNLFR